MTQSIQEADLPPIRDDLEAAKRDLDELGVTRFRGALSSDEFDELRQRLAEQADGERAKGVAYIMEGPNQRVFNLINKGQVFRDWTLNPALSALIGHILGPEYLLFSVTANIASKGGVAQRLHGDQQFSGNFAAPMVANSILMLTDFTEHNGATKIVPGSHRFGQWPQPDEPHTTLPAIGPAGTLLVYDGRLWHGTGANTTDAVRPAILTAYCKPFIRQQENFSLSIAPEVFEACSPELRALLGFQTHSQGGLGMVNGSMAGQINSRPTEFVTKLKP